MQPDVTAIEMCNTELGPGWRWCAEVHAALQHPSRGRVEPIDEPLDVKLDKIVSRPTEWLTASYLNGAICNRFHSRFAFEHPMAI